MGAAAIAARIPLRTAARSRSTACPLAFDRTGGPLVAVCGLAGGAGTTTLALMLAREVAAESSAPVLLTELAADSGGLAAATGHAGPASLAALARRVADGEVPQETFVELAPRLRLIATAPTTHTLPDPDALARAARASARSPRPDDPRLRYGPSGRSSGESSCEPHRLDAACHPSRRLTCSGAARQRRRAPTRRGTRGARRGRQRPPAQGACPGAAPTRSARAATGSS